MIALSGMGIINSQGGWNPDPPPAVPSYENCSAVDFACLNRNNAKGEAYQSLLAIATYGHDGDGNGPLGYLDRQNNTVSQTPYVPPVSQPTTNVVGSSFTFYTTGYKVGDSWTITITGLPGNTVRVVGGQNGASSNTTMGIIPSNGSLVLNGKFTNDAIGSWHEDWYVNEIMSSVSTKVGTLNFIVTAVTVTPTPIVPVIPVVPQSQATSGTTSQVPTSTTQDTATNASMFDLFGTMDNNIQIAGYDVGIYTLAAAIGVIVVGSMMMNKKGRF